MRAVIQRVKSASVAIDDKTTSTIGPGIVIFLGIHRLDGEKEIAWMIDKTINLRIFPDSVGKMNHSLSDINGEMLIVSQFTLYGDCRKGRRPSFVKAMAPDVAERMCNEFAERARALGVGHVAEGRFGAMMDVALVNDGPVTFWLET